MDPLKDEAPDLSRIHQLESEFLDLAAKHGLPAKQSTAEAYFRLSKSSELRIAEALRQLVAVIGAVRRYTQSENDVWDDKEFFQLSIGKEGLTFDPALLDLIEDGDVVEAYNMKRIQFFRNMRFMELSSYSLLDLLTHEWPALFERNEGITKRLIEYTDQLIWRQNNPIPLGVPRHKVRECLSADKQTLEVEFKCICPLFKHSGEPFGFVGTCAVRPIRVGGLDGKLGFS